MSEMLSSPDASEQPIRSSAWAVSIAFWLVLLSAALLYAAVSVAPRLARWMQIRQDYIANAHRLKALETEVDYLERVRDTLQSDSEFVERLASASILSASNADKIPARRGFIFRSEPWVSQHEPAGKRSLAVLVIYTLTTDQQVRSGLLVLATLLVVYAFRTLSGPGGQLISATVKSARMITRLPLDRYRKPDAVSE